jgi:hypothetical protein
MGIRSRVSRNRFKNFSTKLEVIIDEMFAVEIIKSIFQLKRNKNE